MRVIAPLCYHALHPSQQILPDTQLQYSPCTFSDGFVLVTEGRKISAALSDRCPYNGLVRNVLYGIPAEQDDQQRYIGDLYSLAETQSVVRRLLLGGGYSCCWKIRKTYLSIITWNGLYEKFSTRMPIRLPSVLISLFWCNEHSAVDFYLHNTPWMDECLEILEMTVAALRQERLISGLGEYLVDLFHLAGQAGIRFLILDPFAPMLKGLPLYDD